MSLSHYRCDWTHDGADHPVVIFYEVDDEGRVLRLVDIFRDGRRERDAVTDYVGRERDLPGHGSLVEGDFFESAERLLAGQEMVEGDERISLVAVDVAAFEAAWRPDA
ncbi:MAG: hypothetical protein QM608_04200 [Caulobacter sp.]